MRRHFRQRLTFQSDDALLTIYLRALINREGKISLPEHDISARLYLRQVVKAVVFRQTHIEAHDPIMCAVRNQQRHGPVTLDLKGEAPSNLSPALHTRRQAQRLPTKVRGGT